MTDYNKVVTEGCEKLASKTPLDTVLKRVNNLKTSDRDKELVKACIMQREYSVGAESKVVTKLGLPDKDAKEIVSMATKLNMYTDPKKFNLLIHIIGKLGYKTRKQASEIFSYFDSVDLGDFTKSTFKSIETADKKQLRQLLFNIPSTVKIKCDYCGEEKYLHQFVPGRHQCKTCKSEGKTIKDKRDIKVLVDEAVDNFKQSTPETIKISKLQNDIERVNNMRNFYTNVCCKLMKKVSSNSADAGTLLTKMEAINSLIEMEVE